MQRPHLALTLTAVAAALALVWTGGARGDGSAAPAAATQPGATAPATQPAHAAARDAAAKAAHPATRPARSVEDVLEVLHQANPELEARIREAMKDNPDRVKELVRATTGKLQPILDKKHGDPPMYQLMVQEFRCTTLLEQQAKMVRDASDPGQAQKEKDQLRQLLHERFAVRQQIEDLVLKRREELVAELKQQYEARAKDEDKIVDEELKHILAAAAPKPAPSK
jgi:hypothetical protein